MHNRLSLSVFQYGDATIVSTRVREDRKPKHADGLAWPY